MEIEKRRPETVSTKRNRTPFSCLCCCCGCCELFSCLSISIIAILALIYTGVTTVNYRINIGFTAVKAILNPFFAFLLIISSSIHIAAWIVGLFCPCMTIINSKDYSKTTSNNNNKTRCCSLNCYPYCGGYWRRSILLLMLINYVLVLVPIWSVTSTTGAWLSNDIIATTFGTPSIHQASNFARTSPYNFGDQMMVWFQKQYNPVFSSPKTLTATYRFKNITEATPNPLADALSFVKFSDMGSYSTPDVPYLLLDVYHPSSVGIASSKPPPVIFHIHGGAFVLLDKSMTLMPIADYQRQGYAVVSIQYRLVPWGWNGWDIQKDVIDAFLWVRDNHEMLDIDPNRIVMAGESAGGFASSYLCYLMSATAETWTSYHTKNIQDIDMLDRMELFQQIGQKKSIKGCLNLYAAVNIVSYLDDDVQEWNMLTKVKELVLVMLNKNHTANVLKNNRDDWKELLREHGPYISLPNLVTAMSPPTLSIHGKVDVVVPNIMSVRLHEALDKYNVSNALSIMSGRGHNFDVGEYSAGGQVSWYAFERFLAAVVPIEQNR